ILHNLTFEIWSTLSLLNPFRPVKKKGRNTPMTELEREEGLYLAPYAMFSAKTRGRKYAEEKSKSRTEFQRDRDRIIHCSAFRRMEYKTQVFVNHEGDYYRTRLTHTMEAAQVTRGLARALSLNEDLAEAIALVHDLGHPPFGHAGERPLDRLMAPHGGFEHNAQSLRIVDVLEERYPTFRGLNLSWEVREGIVKHSTRYDRPQVREFDAELAPCLEAQIVDFTDEIAYNAHDIDDGLQSGMLDPEELGTVRLWAEAMATVSAAAPRAPVHVLRYQAVRRLIDRLVTDLIESVLVRLRERGIESLAAVRRVMPRLTEFSPEMTPHIRELKAFPYDGPYAHPRVTRRPHTADRL